MKINIKGMNISYEVSGQGKPVIILHGWGASLKVMKSVADAFEGKMMVYNIDLPGFGESDEPKEDGYDVYSYAEVIKEFTQKLEIKNPVIVAHSFGGRIALVLAGKKLIDVSKLILTGSAGIVPKRGADYYIKVYSYKLMKKIIKLFGRFSENLAEKLKKKGGSEDYATASEKMRGVLVRAVNEDLKYLMPEITAPCLLIWGEKDDAAPLADGKTMEKLIPDAGLVVMPGAGHFAFLEKAAWFGEILRNFCSKEMEE